LLFSNHRHHSSFLGPLLRGLLHKKQQSAMTIGYSTRHRFRKSFLERSLLMVIFLL
jgi:hypothetical protein